MGAIFEADSDIARSRVLLLGEDACVLECEAYVLDWSAFRGWLVWISSRWTRLEFDCAGNCETHNSRDQSNADKDERERLCSSR